MRTLSLVLVVAALTAACGSRLRDGIDLHRSGTYRSGAWTYTYSIEGQGSRSEKRFGLLYHDGQALDRAQLDDRIETPWGMMQYFGPDRAPFGSFGWLLRQTYDAPIDPTRGRLVKPADLTGPALASSPESPGPCQNHAQCSRACSDRCPEDVYGCCVSGALGQCDLATGRCVCLRETEFCAGCPPCDGPRQFCDGYGHTCVGPEPPQDEAPPAEAVGSRGDAGTTQSPAESGSNEDPAVVRIRDLLADPDRYLGRAVSFAARCCGWGCSEIQPHGHPGRTRSDRSVEDGTGAIYVVGAKVEIEPGCTACARLGSIPPKERCHVKVRGTVRKGAEGHPYIGPPLGKR